MSRYFPPQSPPPDVPNPYNELLASLSRINTFNPPVQTCSTGWTFHGLYAGPTSIAFLFYRLSQIYPDLQFKSQSLLDWADAYLELGSHYLDTTRHNTVDTSHCGVINETLCQLALNCLLRNDSSLAVKLCSFASVINSINGHGDGSNEWLYGRAGYLYLLRLVLKLFPDPSETLIRNLHQATAVTIDRILSSPFPCRWLDQPYLGAVHGSIGIVLQILLSCPSPERPAVTQRLRPLLLTILNEQLPSGNFPPLHTKDVHDELVQFCHGSPGVVLSLLSIRRSFKGDVEVLKRIDDVLAGTQPDLLERGLLTKAPCLCHGIPTNALAIDDEGRMIEHLSYFSTASMEGDIGKSLGWLADAGKLSDFAGLYTGEAGRAWVWATVDQMMISDHTGNIRGRSIIGYNDI